MVGNNLRGKARSTFKHISHRASEQPTNRIKKSNSGKRRPRRIKKAVIRQKSWKNRIVSTELDPHFRCQICLRRFRYKYMLHNHIKSNYPGYEYGPCAMTCKINVSKMTRTLYYNRMPIIRKVYDIFSKNTQYQQYHVLSEQQPYRFCPMCNELILPKNLISHLLDHCSSQPRTCIMCNKPFGHVQTLKRHIEHHLNNLKQYNVYACDKCSTYMNWPVQQNQIVSSGTTCMALEKGYTSKLILHRHIEGNFTPLLIMCKVCGIYHKNNKYNARRLYLKCMGFVCLICNKLLEDILEIRQHIRDTHTEIFGERRTRRRPVN